MGVNFVLKWFYFVILGILVCACFLCFFLNPNFILLEFLLVLKNSNMRKNLALHAVTCLNYHASEASLYFIDPHVIIFQVAIRKNALKHLNGVICMSFKRHGQKVLNLHETVDVFASLLNELSSSLLSANKGTVERTEAAIMTLVSRR